MKKGLMILAVLAMALMFSVNSWAFGNNTAIAGAVGIGIGVGIGGDANAKACAVSTNENVNVNKNRNTNTNINKNCNVNMNAVGVKSSNSNSLNNTTTTTADNEGVSQAITQNYEAVRDHIQAPELIQSRAYFTRSKASQNKVQGLKHFLARTDSITISKAKRACSRSDDIDIESDIFFENNFSTNAVQFGESGELMCYLYINQDGTDINEVAAFCKGAANAMALGGTHIQVVYHGSVEVSGGSSWNVGIGGGSSVMRSGDDVALAINGGTGYGEVEAFNTALPALTLAVYFDEAWLSKYDVKAWKHDGFDAVTEKEGR